MYYQSDQEHFYPKSTGRSSVLVFFFGWMRDCMSGEMREKFWTGGKREDFISWLCSGISLARGWRLL